MTYNVTCNTDNNYAQHCCAMLTSLFENNKDCKINLHILTKELSEYNTSFIIELCQRYDNEVKIYNVDETILEGVKFRKKNPLSKAAYYRILLPNILNDQIRKILYLDCDVIVLGSIKELYDIELTNYALAACMDASPYTELHRRQLNFSLKDDAFCSGIMMINLDYWRQNNSLEKLLEYSKRERKVVYLHDQDALNYVFKNKWFVLPNKWNKNPMSISLIDDYHKSFDALEFTFEPRMIHYASSLKPWHNVWTPDRCYYRFYLKLSNYGNVRYINVKRRTKLSTWIGNIRYYLNRYVRPITPNIIEMLILDIFNILRIVYYLTVHPKSLNKKLIIFWIKKYKH